MMLQCFKERFYSLKRNFHNLKIHSKLILLLVVLIFGSLVAVGLSTYYIATGMVNKFLNSNITSTAQQIGYNLDAILGNMRTNAEIVYMDRPTQKFLQNEKIYTRSQFNDIIWTKLSRDKWGSTYLFSSDGRLYGYNVGYANIDMNYKDYEEYKRCKANDDRIIWMTTNHVSINSTLLPEDTKDKLSIAAIIKDFDSMEEVGFLIMTFRENEIFNVYNKVKITDNAFGFIIDKEGYIVSHSDKSLLGKEFPLSPESIDAIHSSTEGQFSLKMNNSDNVVIYETLEATGWKLVYVIPRKDLLKDINLIRNTFALIMIVCFVAAISLALLVSGSISKPIEDIIKVMYKFGKGDLSVRIGDYCDRSDEVGVLANEFNKMISKIDSLIKNNYHIEIKKKEAEMLALQAQINPHFLYNTLDAINFMARKYKVNDISKMVIALGDLMRISIRKDINMITVKDEINYIRNYITIQSMRYRDRLSLEVNVDETILNITIPKLILQPAVENAVVHGIEEKLGKGTVTVNGYRSDKTIVFEIIDDGVGFDETKARDLLDRSLQEFENGGIDRLDRTLQSAYSGKGSNIGLLNVDMRLKMIYGKEYGISINSRPGEGTKVTIVIPFTEMLFFQTKC